MSDLAELEHNFEEYAALWGSDPAYDRLPRHLGDGYLFYNFAVEGRDPEFLNRFIPAIDRTIAACRLSQNENCDDVFELEELKEECQRRLGELK